VSGRGEYWFVSRRSALPVDWREPGQDRRGLRQLGITRVMGRIPNAHEPGAIELLGREVVPAAGDLA
jgi:hypothetical protein